MFLFLISIALNAQHINQPDKEMILSIMQKQENCWNRGNLICFMEGYWKSDSLKFIGKNGITHGWQKTLERYQKSYPDKATMGMLKFDILSVEQLAEGVVLLIGNWHLSREKGDVGGHFSLVWKRIGGQWVIIADHSS